MRPGALLAPRVTLSGAMEETMGSKGGGVAWGGGAESASLNGLEVPVSLCQHYPPSCAEWNIPTPLRQGTQLKRPFPWSRYGGKRVL